MPARDPGPARLGLHPDRAQPRPLLLAAILGLLLWGALPLPAAEIFEAFTNDPVAAGRFTEQTGGTESRFTQDPATGTLTAVLDVDAATASYLSQPFPALTELDNLSFSFRFRVEDLDNRVPPTSFIGLMTPQHVENFGDGLTVNVATTGGQLVATASIDNAGFKSEGAEIPLAPRTDYVAAAAYSPVTRRLVVDIYTGPDFTVRVGRSEATLPTGRSLQVTHLGLQNGGARTSDSSTGSLRMTLDDLSLPGRPPVTLSVTDLTVTEGTEGAVSAVLQVLLSTPVGVPVTVEYATRDGSAVAGIDYRPVAGTLVIPAGATGARLPVTLIPDALGETNETFQVVLANPTHAKLATDRALISITDDDRPRVDAGAASIVEGAAGPRVVLLPVRLGNPSSLTVQARFTTADGTALAGSDYQSTNGLVSFPPGVTHVQLALTVFGDAIAEGNESFQVRLSELVHADPGETNGLVTLLDDDAVPTLDVGDASVVEGDAGPRNAAVTLRLSNPSAVPVLVSYVTSDVTATAGADYLARSGSLTFAPGEQEKTLAVTVLGDTTPEPVETLRLTLSSPVNAVLGKRTGGISIIDDDSAPALRVADASVVEGPAGVNATLEFTITLFPPATAPVTVSYATFGGTATAGVDFASASGTLNFPPGTTNRTVSVSVFGDGESEPDESFTLRLTNPLNAALADAEASGVILTDDSVTLSVADATVTEGDGVEVQAVFVVTLRGSPTQPVTVSYFTSNRAAEAGADYRARSGSLTFQPGQTVQTISVAVLGDLLDEPEETFELNLQGPVGASLSRPVGTARIADNDPPALSVANLQVIEGSTGPTNARVYIRLSSPTFEEVRVDYSLEERTASAGSDFVPARGTLVFPAGLAELPVDITILGDTLNEADETLVLRLQRPVGATLSVSEALITIKDDDEAPRIRISDRQITECTDGTAVASFVVTLSAASELPVTVRYSTEDGTARAGEDYVAVTGLITFPPGTTTQQVQVPLICDSQDEGTEGFGVLLSGPGNGFIEGEGRGRGTVVDDDPPEIRVEDLATAEGDDGLTNAFVRLRLSSPSAEAVTVEFTTGDGTATAGTDYAAVSGVVTFPAGIVLQEVNLPIVGDTLPEGDETLVIRLANSLNASLPRPEVIGIIRDDDQPGFRPEDTTVVETDAGLSVARIPVRLTRTSPQVVEIRYATLSGTAVAGRDFEATSGLLRFAPGEQVQEIPVNLIGDTLTEGNETFLLQFSQPVNGVLGVDQARVTVVDNDGAPVLSVADERIDEGNAGPRNLVFTLRLSSPSATTVSVAYSTANVSATAGSDYVARGGTASFAPGSTNQTVAVPVLGDTSFEPEEVFLLVLGNPANAVLARNQAQGIIRNDDQPSVVTVGETRVTEGSPGSRTNLVFPLLLSAPNSTPVSVAFTALPGTATPGADFEPVLGTATFPAGTTTLSIPVPVIGDAETEGPETVILRLANPANATLGPPEAIGTILDDESIGIRAADASIVEADVGSVGLVFTISLDRPSPQLIIVTYSTGGGSASPGADYTTSSGTLFFPPGLTTQTLTIPVLGDVVDEPDETFELRLANPVNGALERAVAVGTILDNDPPAVSISDVTVVGSQSGIVEATFTVTLSTPTLQPVSVNYSTANGSATAGTDYSEDTGTLAFSPGQVQRTVTIQVKGNTLDEVTEFFLVNLSNPVNATAGRMQGRGTILNRVVVNNAPTVALTSPAPGSTFVGPTNLVLAASAADSEGPVAQVEFFVGAVSLGTGLAVPFTLVWTNAQPGTYTLTAQATDSGGLVATSTPVRITITLPNQPPSLSDLLPQSTLEDSPTPPIRFQIGDLGTPAGLLQVSATAATAALLAPEGLRLGGEGTNRTLTLLPAPDQHGTTAVTVAVRDAEGLSAARSFNLTILPVNDAPTLSPLPNLILEEDSPAQVIPLAGIGTGAANETQSLRVTATSSNPSLVPHPTVTYSSSGPTGTLTVQPLPDVHGTAIVTVVLRDDGGTENGGQDTVTRQFTVTVRPANDPPAIRWETPADGASFVTGSTIPLGVVATDPDDGIASVEFLLGGQLIGQVTRPPYLFPWVNVPAGSHLLTARARDSAGATAVTLPLRLTVADPAGNVATGDILILRRTPAPEIDALRGYLAASGLRVRDLIDGHLREPEVVVAAPSAIALAQILAFRLIIWDDLGNAVDGLQPGEIQLLWESWRFGIPIYFIGEGLALPATPLPPDVRERWTELVGLVPGGNAPPPGLFVAQEPRDRPAELFQGTLPDNTSVEDFAYPTSPRASQLVGNGEVRGTLNGVPVLVRYPAINNPDDFTSRRLVQSFLITGGTPASVEERRKLFLNGVVWLLGTECDNFSTTTVCAVVPPGPGAEPCAPFVLTTLISNNGRCDAGGLFVTNQIPEGLELAETTLTSIPEGVNEGFTFRQGRNLVHALGRIRRDSQIRLETRVIPISAGAYSHRTWTRSNFRPLETCAEAFTVTGPGCGQPRLEVRLNAAGEVDFRVAEPKSGTVTVQYGATLGEWSGSVEVQAGVWLPLSNLYQPPEVQNAHVFLRIHR